jgi:transcription antitermination factor NusG
MQPERYHPLPGQGTYPGARGGRSVCGQGPMTDAQIHGDIERRWFALRVKSRCEKMVAGIAFNKGFDQYLPLYHCRRRRSDRFKSVELPLFPGYVFCRLNPQHRLALLTAPGVLYFVGIGRIPTPIDDEDISAIQLITQPGLGAEPWPFLDIGQRVSVEFGPLAGLEGLLVEVRKQHRIVISVTLLRRAVAVEIERDWVRPLGVIRYPVLPNAPSPVGFWRN